MALNEQQQAILGSRQRAAIADSRKSRTVGDELAGRDYGLDSDIRNFVGGAKQLAAGVVSNFVPSPQAIEEIGPAAAVIPNIAWEVASIPSAINMGLRSLFGAENKLDSVIDKPLYYSASGTKNAEDIVGAEAPTNTLGSISRIGGKMLSVPPLVSLASKPAAALSPISQAAKALTYPGIQARTGAGAVVEVGAVSGLSDTILEATDPNYTSGIWTADLEEESIRLDANNAAVHTPPALIEQQRFYNQTPGSDQRRAIIDARKVAETGKTFQVFEEDTQAMEGSLVEAEDEGFPTGKLAAIVTMVGAVATAAGRRTIARSNIQKQAALSELSTAPDFKRTPLKKVELVKESGNRIRPQDSFRPDSGVFTTGDLTKAQLIDWTWLPKKLVKEQMELGTISQKEGQELLNMTTLQLDRKPVTAMVKEFLQSGELPDIKGFANSLRMTPVTHILNRQNSLSNAEKATMADMRLLGNAADRLKNANKAKVKKGGQADTVWGDKTDPNAIRYTEAGAEAEYQALMDANPRLATRLRAEQDGYKQINEYLYRSGQISGGTYGRRATNPRYAPTGLANREKAPDFNRHRTDLEELNSILPGESVDPITLLPSYYDRAVSSSIMEQARLAVLENNADSLFITTRGNNIVRRVTGKVNPKKIPETYVTAKKNGKDVYFDVDDAHYRNTIDRNPSWGDDYMNGIWKTMHRVAAIKKSFTTGIWSDFAATSATYDVAGSVLAKDGKLATSALRINAGGLANGDPTAILNPISGTIANINSKYRAAMAQRLDGLMYNNSVLRTIMPDDATIGKLSNRMQQAYLRSSTRMYERFGGGASPLLDDATDIGPDMLSQVAPAYARNASPKMRTEANTLFNSWRNFNDAIHGSNRAAIFDANAPQEVGLIGTMDYYLPDGTKQTVPYVGRNLNDGFDYKDLSRKVMEAGVNPNKMGGIPGTAAGQTYRRWLRTTMYGNISIQTTWRLGSAMAKDPLGTASAATAMVGGGLLYIQGNVLSNPKALEMYQGWSEQQRAQGIPVVDEAGNLQYVMAVPVELRPVWSPMIEGTLTLQGYTEKKDFGAKDAMAAAVKSIGSDVIFTPIPQAARVAISGVKPFLSQENELGRFISAPTADNPGIAGDTVSDDTRSAIYGSMNELGGSTLTEILAGALSFYYSQDRGTPLKERAGDAIAHVGSSKNVTGRLYPLLYRNQSTMEKALTSNNLDNSWTYETNDKIQDWMSQYKTITQRGDVNPNVKSVDAYSNGPFTSLADPVRESIIAQKLLGFQGFMNQQGWLSDLSQITKEKQGVRYGGSAYVTPQSKRAEQNALTADQNRVLATMRQPMRMIEQSIATALFDAGYSTGWTFADMPRYPEPKGRSYITPSTRPHKRSYMGTTLQ